MAILYEPKRAFNRSGRAKKGALISPKKLARDVIENTGSLNRKNLDDLSLKVIKQYKEKYGLDSIDATDSQAIQRIQNNAVYEIAQSIKENYDGAEYEWLPSDADTPDPEHQLNYGKVFKVGVGEMPGERYGCKCGMNILVKETRLNL